jgi:alanine racemase
LSLTVAEISLPALRQNFQQVARRVGTSIILAVVKANAYGHGAVRVSQILLACGARRLGVATIAEGVELRQAGVTAPVLVMGGALSDGIAALLEYDLTPVLISPDCIASLVGLASGRSSPLPVHLKIDTGMGRLGLSPKEAVSLLNGGWPSVLRLEGLMSHLASADEADAQATEAQLTEFRAVLEHAKRLGITIPLAHIAGSAGILGFPASHFDLVRPGLMLYGYAPGALKSADLRPVLTWKTQIVQVKRVTPGQAVSYGGTFLVKRPTTLAVLAVGYADGYSRAFSNRGRVLIHDRVVPVVGRVCMDLTIVDVTDIPPVSPGDEAVLIGQQGSSAITADDLASQLGTISYEVLSQIGPRVVRLYKESS